MSLGPAWRAFDDEIARWRDAGRPVDFWWRDDDAQRADPALQRLIDLAQSHGVPLALAVIPWQLQPDVVDPAHGMVTLLQHGADHRSRAAIGDKKSEFPDSEPVDQALARLAHGWIGLQALGHARRVPVLVPPWNRIASTALLPCLAAAGYRGLSRFGPRAMPEAAPGLRQVNTHVDIIDWRGSRGFVGEEAALGQAIRHLQARREGAADAQEATGWLSHHAVHDAGSWDFLQRLLERTRDNPTVVWRGAEELFGGPAA